jgi:hypothetical protein
MCTFTLSANTSPGASVFSRASTSNALSTSCTNALISAGTSESFWIQSVSTRSFSTPTRP